jgi:N-carbamoylputrescine amidase
MRRITVAATQFACSWNREANIDEAERLTRQAAAMGGQVILLQELFETPYFCIEQDARHLALATTREGNPAIARMRAVARELGVVLPVSWFERAGQALFNAVAVIDADGAVLGVYRKSHIPNGVGYQEKQYFTPGDTGFRVWSTAHGRIGVGICWDQWFPEAARCMVMAGAEILLYPTAIGSEPGQPDLDSRRHWRTVMRGHAGANLAPVVAANRIGTERARYGDLELTFYGTSFIADHRGEVVAEMDDRTPGVIVHGFDLDAVAEDRAAWGVWRDRRPELYGAIVTHDGGARG